MLNAVHNQIRQLKNITPNPDWLQSERARLLLEISQSGKSRTARERMPVFVLPARLLAWPQFVFKPVVALGLVLCLIFGGGALTVLAAKNSLPGDLFYPIKIVLEDARMKVSSQENQSRLQAEFVGVRTQELSQIMGQNEDLVVKKERVVEAVGKLQARVVSANLNLNKIRDRETGSDKLSETAAAITEQAAQSEKALLAAKEKLVSEFEVDESSEVVKAIDAAVKEIQATSTLAAEITEGKVGAEVQMEVKETSEPEIEKFKEASASFEEIKP